MKDLLDFALIIIKNQITTISKIYTCILQIFHWTKILKDSKYDIILPSKISREGGASEGYSFSKYGIKKMINKFKILKYKNSNIEMIDEGSLF